MKSISLSIKIHIPVIYQKHPFSEIAITDEYLDTRRTELYTQEIVKTKLSPFLNTIKEIAEQYKENFSLALSISGITIRLLEKYAPDTINEIRLLTEEGVIEFFAEPWSYSILSYIIEKELVKQTAMHRITIEKLFNQTPTVFFADTTINAELYNQFEPFPGCKTIFTYSNHVSRQFRKNNELNTTAIGKSEFLINHYMSSKFQHLVSDNSHAEGQALIAPFIRYIRKYVSLVKPLILLFDPLANNITNYNKLKEILIRILNHPGGSFYSLTDLEEVAKYFSIENDYSEAMLSQFKYPDCWLRNNMQQEAFKQFKSIYKFIHSGEKIYVPEAWDYLQDLNNYFYMSDFFFLEEFASRHFSPFRSPHEAFTSYMNAAGNFWNIKDNNTQSFFRTNFLFAPTIN